MELVLVVDIHNPLAVLNACTLAGKHDAAIYLKVNSRDEFNEFLDLSFEPLLEYAEYVIGLIGPRQGRLFEDTVYIATQLEDLCNIELESITTPWINGSSHVEELVDLFNSQVNITVSSWHDVTSLDGLCCPITMALNIERMNIINGFTNVGMEFDATFLPAVYTSREVFVPIQRYVYNISYFLSVGYKNNLNYSFELIGKLTKYGINKNVCITFDPEDYKESLYTVEEIVSRLKDLYF
jgi:hypothetical protein